MQKWEEDKVIVRTENNEEKVIYQLLTFKSKNTNKEYLVYTGDNDTDDIFASILKLDETDIKLEKIVDEVDKEEVRKALLKAKISIKSNLSFSETMI